MTIPRNSKKKTKPALPIRRLNLLLVLTLSQILLLIWFIWLVTAGSWQRSDVRQTELEMQQAGQSETTTHETRPTSEDRESVTETPAEAQVEENDTSLPPMRTPIRVEVLNGTSISKLAWRFSQGLIEKGIDVLETANANRPDYRNSRIICRSDDVRQANQLAQMLRFPLSRVEMEATPDLVDIDVTIILGADYEQLQIPR